MQSKTLQITSPESLAHSALERWEPHNPSPLPKDELSTVIADLSAKMEPASPEQYAAAMIALAEFATAFGIVCPAPGKVQEIYRETLKNLPADLLARAIARVKISWVWGNRMPFPADILNTVKEDFAKRQSLLSRAKVAMLKAPETAGRKNVITPEQWEDLRRKLAKTTASISRASSTAGPKSPEKDEPIMTQAELDARRQEILNQCERT